MAILCEEINLLFICVPKTGSSSLEYFLISKFGGKQVLTDHIWDDARKNILVDSKHIRIKEIISHELLTLAQLEQMKILVVTRNPFDWVVSCYVFVVNSYQRLKQEGEKAPNWITSGKDWITKIASMSFDEYVAHEFNNKNVSVYSSFIEGIDERKVEVVKLEQLDIELKRIFQELGVEWFHHIPYYNKTKGKKKDFRRYYSNKSRQIIEQSFARDFQRLGYSFDDFDYIETFTIIKKIINYPDKFERKLFGYNIEIPKEYLTNATTVFLSGWVLPKEDKEVKIIIEGGGVIETFSCNIQRDDVTKYVLGEINPNIKCGFDIHWPYTGIFNISFIVEGEKMLIAETHITSSREIKKDIQQWEEAIITYQRALEINPGCTSLNCDIAEAYYQLGKKYVEQNQLEKATECYQKALEKQPHQKQAYYDLKEMIAKDFYELFLQNTEVKKLSEGIKYFQNVSMMQTKGHIYDHIWQGLNSPGFLDETSLYCEIDIIRENVETYFANRSSYRIIRLWDVTADDQEYLKKVDLSLVQIELMQRDQCSLEEIYGNSFLEKSIEIYPQQELRNERSFQQSIQQSIIETGYIYSVCPFSGKTICSNQSYVIGDIWPTPVHFYRFEGKEIFYLLVGDWIGDKMYIYIPSIELIIQLRHLVSNLQGVSLFNKFKAYLVSEWQEVISYINKPQKEIATILGFFSSNGYYTWDGSIRIQYLHERDIHKRIQVKDPQNLFKTVLSKNCFTFRITDLSIKEDLANRTNRIIKGSYKRCSQEFLQQIEIAKQNFPLVCFQIRTHIPFWLSQVEGIANIINKLSKDYPNLGVVFDGWSRTEIDSPGDNEMIARENREVAKIIDRLDKKTKVYNAIGCKTYEKVVWTQTIDTYVAPSGSGLTFLSTIANKMGIVHGDSEFYHHRIKLDLSLSPENGIPPLLVAGYPLEGDMTPAIHRNYECDWKAIYDEVVKIIQSSLSPER